MARGKKNLTLDEQLAKTISEIENTEILLKELKDTKKELEERIHQEKLCELDKMIQESGLSFQEIKEILCKKDIE